jgi:hypothetical protein
MNAAPTSAPETTSANHRDTTGRFGNGNDLASNIPYARHVASLRTALAEAVTPDDLRAIAARLVEASRNGDKTATKLLFQYVIGKPQPAVDPDRLVIEAFRLLHQSAVPPEAVAQIARGVPVQFLLTMLPLLLDAKASQLGAFVKGECDKMDAKDRRREERAQARAERKRQRQEESEEAAAPLTNGDCGDAQETREEDRPLTNGDCGDGVLNVFLNWLRGGRNGSDPGPRT